MSNSILIGTIIKEILSKSIELTDYIDDKIFPIVALEGTTYPFVTYSRTNVYPNEGTKDGWCGDAVSFEIQVESKDYDESCIIANIIRGLFENCDYSNSNLSIYNTRMTSISEVFGNDNYIQTLDFECNTGQ